MNDSEFRRHCGERLADAHAQAGRISAFIGVDGFVDSIIHLVGQRHDAKTYERIPTIAQFAQRIAAAAGKSTNIEAVPQRVKLGGNGPILANALAAFGLNVTYLGALGYPEIHPVFKEMTRRAEVHSICDVCTTDALEFEDGKLLLGKTVNLNEVTWENIQKRFGRNQFASKFQKSDLVGFVNWTMVPCMSDLWKSLLKELCPKLKGPRRKVFFDLADPEKRPAKDIREALKLINRFEEYFDVILGLNEKEAYEIGEVLKLNIEDKGREALLDLALGIAQKVKVSTLVIHPVTFALAVSQERVDVVDGPFCPKPLITTGAGDHFNAGFCLGKLFGFDNRNSLLTGVSTSGYYVRTAKSPNMLELAGMMRKWPSE